MAGQDIQGVAYPGDLRLEYYNDITDYIQSYEVERHPILALLGRVGVDTPEFDIRHFAYDRPRKYNASAGLAGTTTYSTVAIPDVQVAAGLTPGDSTCLMDGDVLEVDSTGERLEVIRVPVYDPATQPQTPTGQTPPPAGSILVKRGASATTVTSVTDPTGNDASGNPNRTSLTLIGNSRTGGEVWTTGIRARPMRSTQVCQNFQYKVEVTQTAQTTKYEGFSNLFEKQKGDQFRNFLADEEYSLAYGKFEPVGTGYNGYSIGNRPKMRGLVYQAYHQVTASNGTNYRPEDFENDVMLRLFDVKHQPNVMYYGRNWMKGFTKWYGQPSRFVLGTTKAGIVIEAYSSPFAPNMALMPCPTLKPGDALIGRADLARIRVKRPEKWNDYGYRGDRIEGEWTGELAGEILDPETFVYLNGATTFGTP